MTKGRIAVRRKVNFDVIERRICMNRWFRLMGIEWFANRFSYRWEYLSFILPARFITYRLRIRK